MEREMRAGEKAFTRGATSALDLFGVGRKEELDFTYKGKDLRRQSTSDVIENAWELMGSLMFEFYSEQFGKE